MKSLGNSNKTYKQDLHNADIKHKKLAYYQQTEAKYSTANHVCSKIFWMFSRSHYYLFIIKTMFCSV